MKVTRSRGFAGVSPSESTDEETIDVRQFTTDTAEVGTSVGITLNMGDFEFVRIDVTYKVPCYVEESEDAYAYAYKFASEKLRQHIAEIRLGNKEKSSVSKVVNY